MDTDHATSVESDTFEGELARAIRLGEVEVNPHMTPERKKTFVAHVAFFDRVVAMGMAEVEAGKRALIAAGLMTEDGILTEKATHRVVPDSYWLMEMERESLQPVPSEAESEPELDPMLAKVDACSERRSNR